MAKLAVKIAKVLVRGGMALEAALREAVRQARVELPEATDSDERLMEALKKGVDLRQFTQQLDAAADVADPVKRATENRLYERKPNEDTAAFAARIADATGDAAAAVFRDPNNGLGGAERTMLGHVIVKRLSAAGRPDEAARFLDDDFLPYSTHVGQALQGFAAFGRLTPEGALVYAKRQFNRAAQSVRERAKPTTDALADALQRVNQRGIEAAANSPEVQQAAASAIDEAFEHQAGVSGTPLQKALQEETIDDMRRRGQLTDQQADGLRRILSGQLAGGWGVVFGDGSSTVQTRYREARKRVRRQIKTRANRIRATEADTTAQRILRRFALSQSDTPTAPRRGGPNPVETAVQSQLKTGRLSEADFAAQLRRLGVAAPTAGPLASVVMRERVIRERIARERRALDQRPPATNEQTQTAEAIVAKFARLQSDTPTAKAHSQPSAVRRLVERQLETRELTPDELTAELQKLGVEASSADTLTKVVFRELAAREIAAEYETNPIDRAIRSELRRMRATLGTLVREHFTKVDAAGRTIVQRLVEDAALPEEAAARLGKRLQGRFAALVKTAKEQELAKLERVTPAAPHKVKPAFQRIVELSNLGGIDRESAWNAVTAKLRLPKWTSEVASEVSRRAGEIQRTPEGFRRDQKVVELHNYLAREMGVPLGDLATAFWYANILSGLTTHGINLIANFQNLVANLVIQARNPADFVQQAVALGRGLKRGGVDAADILRTGIATRTGDLKLQASRPLELVRLPGWTDYLLTPWRLVGRALAAADALFFRSAEEMRRTLLARQIARDEGLSGPPLRRREAELTGRLEQQRAAAVHQAQLEGLSGITFRRRVAELLDEATPEGVRQSARDFALGVTFNQKPYGFLGQCAEAIHQLQAGGFGTAVRLVVPFTNIIANVVNESLNYVPPIGLGRAFYGHWHGELEGRPIVDRNALGDQYAKAALGTALMGVIWAAAEAYLDDDDSWFAITGAGPAAKNQRDQLRASGWVPYSIKLGGRWYPYAAHPALIGLGIMGNWFDAKRYRKLEERSAWDRLAFVLMNSGKVITQQSFLDGLAGLASVINRDNVKAGDDLAKSLGRTASSFVVPNALRQIDRWFDPTVYDAPTVEAALAASIPFARRMERPALNPWGEPVRVELSKRFVSSWKPTRMEQVLIQRGLWISAPRRDTVRVEGQPLTDPEFYEYIRARGQALRRLVSERETARSLETDSDADAGRLWGRLTRAAAAEARTAVSELRKQ